MYGKLRFFPTVILNWGTMTQKPKRFICHLIALSIVLFRSSSFSVLCVVKWLCDSHSQRDDLPISHSRFMFFMPDQKLFPEKNSIYQLVFGSWTQIFAARSYFAGSQNAKTLLITQNSVCRFYLQNHGNHDFLKFFALILLH